MSQLPAVCQPPGALKRGQASQYLSAGGDFQSPHYLLSNGVLPNCLLSPSCPAGSLPCSLPEPGRLIKTCAVLAQGMCHNSGASGTGTAPTRLLVLQQQTLLTVADVTRGSSYRNTWGTVFSSRPGDQAVPKRAALSSGTEAATHSCTPVSPSLPSLSSACWGF